MSLPPRFVLGNAFEDWAEKYWAGCVRPDEKTETIARAAFDAGESRMFNEADGAQLEAIAMRRELNDAYAVIEALTHENMVFRGQLAAHAVFGRK